MFPDIFKSIFETEVSLQPADFLLCLLVSLAAGIFLAVISTYGARYTQSFVVTLALLPPIVCTVILLVNGSIGAGVAVAGAFNLVRFRSGNLRHFSGHGHRSYCRHGLSLICCLIFPDSGHRQPALYPFWFWYSPPSGTE